MKHATWIVLGAAWLPFAMGARGGCGPVTSTSAAPDVEGRWALAYGDTLDVKVSIGGAVYDAQIPADGGTVLVEHAGFTIPFSINCADPNIVCPSEVWPESVTASQRNPDYPHQMWVTIPGQACDGEMVAPDPSECGQDTLNPDCEMICEGEVRQVEHDTFGVIDEAGERFDLLLGAGIASNGVNCVLLGISSAHADLVSTGDPTAGNWVAQEMTNGEVAVAYAGGCLWAGDTNMDEELEALVLGASVRFSTPFAASRIE